MNDDDSINSDEIILDSTPSGEEEAEQFENPEDRRRRLELDSYEQDMEERKLFAERAYGITQTWIGFLVVITIAQLTFGKSQGMGLTETEFGIVFTTTTASVFGFWVLVGQYLFRNGKK